MTFADAKQRFSNRVNDYVRYRPSYPSALLDLLRAECDLRPDRSIADIGSGTGLLTKLFLDNGNRVFGVEPNEEMRAASELFLQTYKDFSPQVILHLAAEVGGIGANRENPGRYFFANAAMFSRFMPSRGANALSTCTLVSRSSAMDPRSRPLKLRFAAPASSAARRPFDGSTRPDPGRAQWPHVFGLAPSCAHPASGLKRGP